MASIEMMEKDFLAEKKFEGLTENSLRSYVDFFKLWNKWLTQEGIERVEELDSKKTKGFLIWCQDVRKNKPKTINTKLKLMRAFARWLVEKKLTEEPFAQGVKMQREDDAPKILSEKDLQDVLRHLRRVKRRENTFTSRRNYTLILLLAGSGLSLSEVCSLRWNDVDFDSLLISIRTSKSRNILA
jgi:integrase/recombinase XerD